MFYLSYVVYSETSTHSGFSGTVLTGWCSFHICGYLALNTFKHVNLKVQVNQVVFIEPLRIFRYSLWWGFFLVISEMEIQFLVISKLSEFAHFRVWNHMTIYNFHFSWLTFSCLKFRVVFPQSPCSPCIWNILDA